MATKWKDRGYWVSLHFYWQSLIHYFYNCARFRSLTFFSAVNPAIPFGGMLDDRKSDIDPIIPKKYRPKTIKYLINEPLEKQLLAAGIQAPFIVKPDVGLKGYKVRYFESKEDANIFLSQQAEAEAWIIQSYIDFKREFSILYYHNPIKKDYGVLSLIEKQYPIIKGDGKKNIKTLIEESKNVNIDKVWILEKWVNKWDEVLPEGEQLIIDNIGNYSRGSSFHSMMDQVTPTLVQKCKSIFDEFEGVHFFRMDLKADSLEAFLEGDFKVIEINGAKGEPLHIYDRQHSFWSNIKDIHKHWKILSEIVTAKQKSGYQFPDNIDGLRALRSIKQIV